MRSCFLTPCIVWSVFFCFFFVVVVLLSLVHIFAICAGSPFPANCFHSLVVSFIIWFYIFRPTIRFFLLFSVFVCTWKHNLLLKIEFHWLLIPKTEEIHILSVIEPRMCRNTLCVHLYIVYNKKYIICMMIIGWKPGTVCRWLHWNKYSNGISICSFAFVFAVRLSSLLACGYYLCVHWRAEASMYAIHWWQTRKCTMYFAHSFIYAFWNNKITKKDEIIV